MLKKLLYVVVAIVVASLLLAAVLPGSYSLERSIEIGRPPEVVYDQVADYNAWLEWSPWPKADAAARHEVTGTPGEVGMTWSWRGEELGVGRMTLAEVDENRSIHSKLVFEEPMQSEADDYMTLEPTAGGTRVTWRNAGDLPWPIGRYFGLGLESMLGPQYEQGLASLKALCESLPEPAPEVEEAPEGEEGSDEAALQES